MDRICKGITGCPTKLCNRWGVTPLIESIDCSCGSLNSILSNKLTI